MLCRAGQLTKRDIGAIKIQEEVSHVELSSDSVDRFLEAIGGEGVIEKNITIKRLDKMPTSETPKGEAPTEAPTGEAPKGDTPNARKQDRAPSRAPRGDRDSKRNFDRKPSGRNAAEEKPARYTRPENRPPENKPTENKPARREDTETPSQTSHEAKAPTSNPENLKPEISKPEAPKPETPKPETPKPTETRAPKPAENKSEYKSKNKSPLANPSDPKSGRRTPSGGKSAGGKANPHKKGWAKAKPKPAFKKPRKVMMLKGDKPNKTAKPEAQSQNTVKPGCAPMKRKKPRNDR